MIHRLLVAPLALAKIHAIGLSLLLAISPALASQNQLSSPTTGTVSGLQLTNNYNNALDSVNTCNSGTSAPTNQLSGVPSLGNCWLNTTASPDPLQWYDSAQWVKAGFIDTTNHLWNAVVGGGTANVASAATTDPCSTSANYITITGTTNITSFGSTCETGQEKTVTFAGVLTLTYNATSLIIPGAANVTTATGDIARLRYLGSSNWQIEAYFAGNGQPLINPAIDVGAVEWTFSPTVPSSKYLLGYGQTVSRTTYATLQTALTITQSVTRTNGSPTLTGFSDTTQIGAGACVEGTGIPNSGACTTTVLSTTSTTVTMSGNATSSGTANITVYPYGNGDGSTTFGLPDCRGVAMAGRDNMGGTARGKLTSTYALANPDALGMTLGSQNHTLTQAELPAVAPTFTGTAGTGTLNVPSGWPTGNPAQFGTATVQSGTGINNIMQAAGGTGWGSTVAFTPTGTISNLGSGSAHSIVPPMLTANCMIRVLP